MNAKQRTGRTAGPKYGRLVIAALGVALAIPAWVPPVAKAAPHDKPRIQFSGVALDRFLENELRQEFCALGAQGLSWDWIFLGETEWQTAVRQALSKSSLHSETAISLLDGHRTWLRRAAFCPDGSHDLKRTIAHELAHIKLNTQDEGKAVAEAQRILEQSKSCELRWVPKEE